MNKTFSCRINYIILEIKEVEYLRRVSVFLCFIKYLPVGAFPGWVHYAGLAEPSWQRCVWLLGGYDPLQ